VLYIGLATLFALVPVGGVAQMARTTAPATTATRAAGHNYHNYHSNYFFYGGGRGGWLGNSYGWGTRGYDYDRSSGSAGYRAGGPGGGGK